MGVGIITWCCMLQIDFPGPLLPCSGFLDTELQWDLFDPALDFLILNCHGRDLHILFIILLGVMSLDLDTKMMFAEFKIVRYHHAFFIIISEIYLS